MDSENQPNHSMSCNVPPPLSAASSEKSWCALSILLSLCLGLFLADAAVSLVDDSLILISNVHLFAGIRGVLFFLATLIGLVVYVMIGITPRVPKRLFVPISLFNPVASLAVFPFVIYYYDHLQQVSWAFSLCQLVLGLTVLYRIQGGFKFRWPFVAQNQIRKVSFSWRNLLIFLLVNLFILIPAVLVYCVVCTSVAVNHYTDGFLVLRPGGLTVQVKKYARKDGKTIQLFPMSHVGDAIFYRKLSQSFPSNSIILMEGVTDNQNLLTNKITYKRMAKSLGLAEQQQEFKPVQGEMVRADIDVDQFSTNTLNLLNLVMLVHTKGLNAASVLKLTQYSPPPHYELQLFDDLLTKRNRHLLEEIDSHLSESENIIVPWGVAHMPGIARGIQKAGFVLESTEEHRVIQFGSRDNKPTAK
jgi:hypothetical protein